MLHFLLSVVHVEHEHFISNLLFTCIISWTGVLLTFFISASTCGIHAYLLHALYIWFPCFIHEGLTYIN